MSFLSLPKVIWFSSPCEVERFIGYYDYFVTGLFVKDNKIMLVKQNIRSTNCLVRVLAHEFIHWLIHKLRFPEVSHEVFDGLVRIIYRKQIRKQYPLRYIWDHHGE